MRRAHQPPLAGLRQANIEVNARDRASAYADAGHTVAPGAQQVADRRHLMVNLYEAIERLLLRHVKPMREATRQLDVRLQLEADELHFSRAADRRGVAQSAVSIQIQQMEEDLGVGSVLVAANPVSNRRMRRAHQEQARARLLAAFFNAAAGSPSGAR
jgi:hypothetical protein